MYLSVYLSIQLSVQDQDTSGFGVWWGAALWFINTHLLTVSLEGGSEEESLLGFFYKSTNPIYGGTTFMT
jgi:hypothetical protein